MVWYVAGCTQTAMSAAELDAELDAHPLEDQRCRLATDGWFWLFRLFVVRLPPTTPYALHAAAAGAARWWPRSTQRRQMMNGHVSTP